MPWRNDEAARRHTNRVYGAEWKRARGAAIKRAGGRCVQCSSTEALHVDHIVPVSQGGDHRQSNLQALCRPCHRRKTATEGGGYRRKKDGSTVAMADPEPVQRTSW